jgi:hypothetical protein
VAGLENPVGPARLRYEFKDLNGNRVYDGPQELGRRLSTLGGAGFVKVDRGLKSPYSDELSAHLEQEIFEGLSGRASFIYKNIRRDWAEVDLARVNAYTIPVDVIDPGPGNLAGAGFQTLHLVDRPRNVAENRAFTNPSGDTADYKTVEVALNRRLRSNWLLLTSFEYTWSQDFRAVDSASNPLTAVGHDTRYLWKPNQRRFGRQPSSVWNYKLIGRYVFPWDVGVSGSYKLQSGSNWARNLSVNLSGAGAETVPVEPINANRAPNVHIVDLRLEKGFVLGARPRRLAALFDVFNLFNANPVTNFRTTTGSRFGEIIALLDPRIIRLGIRYEF